MSHKMVGKILEAKAADFGRIPTVWDNHGHGPWLFDHGPGGSINFQSIHGYSNHIPVGSINFLPIHGYKTMDQAEVCLSIFNYISLFLYGSAYDIMTIVKLI